MASATGRLYWAHTDTRGDLQSIAQQARYVARTGTWIDDPESERLFRVWLVDVLAAVASLGPLPIAEVREGDPIMQSLGDSLPPGRRYIVDLRQAGRADSLDWQTAIVVALAALASDHGKRTLADLYLPAAATLRVTTADADPPLVSEAKAPAPLATAVLPAGVIGAVVIVSCVGLVAGAVGWITSQYFEAKAIGLTADAKSKQTATAIQAAVDVVEKHQAAQVAQGKTLAYDAGELAVLETLRSSIKELSGWEPPALQSVPKLAAGLGAFGSGITTGMAIVIAVAAWLFLSRGGKRAA